MNRLPRLLMISLCALGVFSRGAQVYAQAQQQTTSARQTQTAQQEVITGRVVDMEGKPIGGASVKLMADSTKIVGFAITKPTGEFSLKIDREKKPWKLMFSSVGRESEWRDIRAGRMDDVRMRPSAKELPEVAVKGRSLFSRGDTIVYDVESFTGDADRNLEDVLAKLPGVRITPSGTIEYNGQSINRFYIEGMNMLDGRYTLATRNVKPQDVSKVEVLENHQPVKALRDVMPSDKPAMNIKLKKRSMLRPVGNVKGGGGVDHDGYGLWLGELFGMGISPGFQTILTLKGNDTGQDYTAENTTAFSRVRKAAAAADGVYSSRPFGSAPVSRERYSYNRTLMATANAMKKLKDDMTLRIAATYKYDRDLFSNSERIDYSGVEGSAARLDRSAESRLGAHDVTLESTFEENASRRHISNTLRLHGRFSDNRYAVGGSESVEQRTREHEYDVANALELTFRRGRDAYTINSNIALTNVPLNTLSALITADGQRRVSQSVKGLVFKTTESTMMAWAPGKVHYIGLRLNFDAEYETYRSLGAGPTVESANREHGYDITTSAQLEYELLLPYSSRLSVRAPLALYNMRFVDELTARAYPVNRLMADWSVSYMMPLRGFFSWTAAVMQTSALGSFSNFITNPVYTSYNTLSTPGGGIMRKSRSHSASASVRYRDVVHEFFWNVYASAYRTTTNTLASTTVGSGSISSQEVAKPGLNKGLSVAANASKGLSALRGKVELDASASLGTSRVIRQEEEYLIRNGGYSLGLTVGMQPCGWMAVNINARGTLTHQSGVLTGSRSTTSASAGGRLSFFPLRGLELFVKPDLRYSEVASGYKPTDLFLDGGVRYSRKKWEIELSLRNLTNRRAYSYRTFSGADEYFYSFALRPREYLLTLKYQF